MKERKKKIKLCTVENCTRRLVAKGLCSMHYNRLRTKGDVGGSEPLVYQDANEKPTCIEKGCGKPRYCKGRCESHYRKFAHKEKGICQIEGCKSPAITFRFGLCRTHDAKRRKPDSRCAVKDCSGAVIANNYCQLHYSRWHRYGDPLWETEEIPDGTRRPDRGGYVLIKATGHSEARTGSWASEHRVVMSDYLGRPLRDNENVHHINGDRTNNRIDNLELWVVSQPPGQRARELLDWAEEIIATYDVEEQKL